MPLVNLTLSTLGALANGTAEAIADAALNAAVLDAEDRGVGPAGDGKERQVVLTITILPRKDGNVEIGFHAATKTPRYRTADTIAEVRMREGKPVCQFRDDAAHDPAQKSFRDYEDPSEVKE